MTIRIEPRFDECLQCSRFVRDRLRRECLQCPAGENFDPKVEHEEPTEADLYDMLKDWSHDE